MFSIKRIIFLSLILLLLSSIQRFVGFHFLFSMVDLSLIFLIVLLFLIKNPFEYVFLVIFNTLLFQELGIFDKLSLILIFLFLILLLLKQRILELNLFSITASILVFTFLISFLFNPDQLFSLSFILRLIYNEIVGIIFFIFLSRFEENL